jgi:dipeptidyl aminopeptidase/acylaminoacyl peptidase/CubicO group peptidase (beta-lactamase class C family)
VSGLGAVPNGKIAAGLTPLTAGRILLGWGTGPALRVSYSSLDPHLNRNKEKPVTRRQRVDDLTTFAWPEQPALSPDGNQILYVLRTVDADKDRNERAIWRVGTRTGEPERLTRGPADAAPVWSPDGSRIAFLRAQEGPAQVWLMPSGGGEPEQLTTLPLGAGAPVWSPDGRSLAFSAAVDLLGADADDPKRATAPVVTTRLDYRADGVGLLKTTRKHLHVVDLSTRECRRVTGGDWHASDPAWSPDSTTVAFAAATAPDADLTLRAPVYTLDVTQPASTPTLVGLADGVGGPVVWADAATLLVVGVVGEPLGHARLLRLPLANDTPVVDLTAALDRNVMPGGPAYPGAPPQLAVDGGSVLFCARDRGCTHLYTTSVHSGEIQTALGGAGRVVSGASVVGDTAAVVVATPTSYGEIVTLDLSTGRETRRTNHGATEVALFERQPRSFTISDGTAVEGWLLRDPSVTGPTPLLLDIHGGPHGAWNGAADAVHVYHQVLAARGWTVLVVNPRGSDGYGEQFYKAAVGAWGGADAPDFLEALDALVAEGVADPRRLAVTGYSYGGYMTCYLTSQDHRFAAAAAGGVVVDLTSAAGTSDIGHMLAALELGITAWAGGARDRYHAMSPLSRVDNVTTPMLIQHGGSDLRCPVGQAEQWHTALRERGVPAQLVLYPHASHLFIVDGPPSQRIDWNQRIVDWVQQYAGDARGPRPARIDAVHWRRRLAELATRHKVPGAALGILRLSTGDSAEDDELVEAVYGSLNLDTGVETTTDSLFQIGSISKVWTATIVMQLVDEGLLDLDAPVVDVLPELRLADPDVTKRVTMRHLLTHTSGIDGDVFTDTGRGDDCLEKYVAQMGDVAQNHPLGATWSYCNSGFVLAGRVIEKLTGGTWDEAVRKRIVAPLGLSRTVTLPEEAMLHRTAVGHVDGPDGPTRAPVWQLPRSVGPAGLISATAADLLGFARMHLSGGLAPDGTRVLSEASVAAMASFQADLPDTYVPGYSWGIGWVRYEWDGHRLLGHDGNTIGQAAFLRVLPEAGPDAASAGGSASAGVAVALFTNGGNTRDLYEDLYREIFAELAGVTMPHPRNPPAQPVTVDAHRYAGTYVRASARSEVIVGEDGLMLRTTVTGPLAELMPDPTTEYAMVPVSENLFVVREPNTQTWLPMTFYELPTGERYLHFGVRATPKVD